GRPDMALFLFTKAILADEPIKVFNYGNMKRDFTYIDDAVEGILKAVDKLPEPDEAWDGENPHPGKSWVPYRIYNIGNSRPVPLMELIAILEKTLEKKAIIDFQPIQLGDVPETFADITDSTEDLGFIPKTPIEVGVPLFVEWYKSFYCGAQSARKT
ncbi:MAG: NAD-dependent epimerase/dehydratase family protein, partial [bacterium]